MSWPDAAQNDDGGMARWDGMGGKGCGSFFLLLRVEFQPCEPGMVHLESVQQGAELPGRDLPLHKAILKLFFCESI